MLKRKKTIPLDYSLCTMTVTVYRREGLNRRVLEGVHYEFTDRSHTDSGRSAHSRGFLLVIPGSDPIAPGDKVAVGECPPVTAWHEADGMVVRSVKPRYFYGSICHTEARG